MAAWSWTGVITDTSGAPLVNAVVILRSTNTATEYRSSSGSNGSFTFGAVEPGQYRVSLLVQEKEYTATDLVSFQQDQQLTSNLQFLSAEQTLRIVGPSGPAPTSSSQGIRLSSNEVSTLPLNERDFSKLLLLAAGTMTDSNGAANFTQQFSVNGQRGVTAVFAMDGTATSDPEMGGATFPNFNVDAIQEVQSSSGVMPAEIGEGAGGYTNLITKSGTKAYHGSAFEFARNAAFDARNFFDYRNQVDTRRIPPFVRNEFGATFGGPLIIPAVSDGHAKTFSFVEYQGFRQVLGTTQVFAVPTAAERQGIDTTTFPGDTLYVPVSPAIAPLLARYPLPNDPQGPFGARTYATYSKVVTNTDQFSVRIDQHLSDKAALFGRFSLNQINGPTTNPDQTAIDPTFGVNFFDHQRSATIHYERVVSSHLNFSTAFGYIRSTPIFPTRNSVDPALAFGDGLYEGFNSADGSILGSYGNLYQGKFDMAWTRGTHTVKWGAELRLNKDATIFGTNPNGVYTFGGGTAYSTVQILSASGLHNIEPGNPLPDALTGLLTATPYSYSVTAAASVTPQGNKFDEAAVRREAYNFYVQDSWKFAQRWNLTYGLRYEVNSRIHEAKNRTSIIIPVGPDGQPASFLTPGAHQTFLFNPQPPYPMDWGGWGPRVAVDFAATKRTTWHAGAAVTTVLPNLWQDNFVTGGFPLVFQPLLTALPGTPVPFHTTTVPLALPPAYTTSGQLLFPGGDSANVPANTPIDVQRFQTDVEALTPGHEPQLITAGVIWRGFRNGYIGTYTLGFDHDFGVVKWSAAYVGTAGVHLPSVFSPNGYAGADSAFAPFTQFNAQGQAIGGYGPEMVMQSGSHSSYNALQTSVGSQSARYGLGFQASYTFSKSLDDTSTVLGGIPANAGVTLQALPQNPRDPRGDKGPSTFDVTHVFSLSLIQVLPFDRIEFLKPLGQKLTRGWQLLNVTSLMTGPPFTVYSGIQQTGAGAGGTDRPDLLAMPDLSTSRTVREDYFGRGTANASFFSIPIHVPDGTGPNQGVFGTVGRDTFRGPGFHQFDFALIKNTAFGRRGNAEWGVLQFRAEFFNIFNIVNFGLPSNTLLGTGFGTISKTAGPSRQIQFSLRLAF
ncbi:MAG TPA: TonB-dependent receptor [Candidatus Eremiobacteraceae bacterium]|nr:TonB-dependent receptor [Candidatus Eremiobacteraceae bacterium]